jgi:DNA-binding NarL/FixJ family response regulator
MKYPDCSVIRAAVILKSDRVYAECLRQMTLRAFPGARIEIATTVTGAAGLLDTLSVDLFVTGIGASIDGDVLELLSRYLEPPHAGRHVLVVSARGDYRELTALRTLGIDGVFDSAAEPAEQLIAAIRTVATGGRYWSSTIVDHMIRTGLSINPVVRILTTFEQLALCIIGDGSDDSTAAHELGVSPATVSSVRRDIHRKLGVQHRGELVRVAAQYGFVRFTPGGVVRPGYSLLSAAYQAKRNRRAQYSTSSRRPEPTPNSDHEHAGLPLTAAFG